MQHQLIDLLFFHWFHSIFIYLKEDFLILFFEEVHRLHSVYKVLWLEMLEIQKLVGAKFICETFLDVFWLIVT